MKQTVVGRAARRPRSREVFMLGAVLTMIFSWVLVASPAGAATQTMNFTMTGSTTIGSGATPQDFPAGSGFTATVDTTTGAFTDGVMSIPTYQIVNSGIHIDVTITDTAPATGTIDPVTGVATITVHAQTSLFLEELTNTCVLGPFTVTLKTANSGGSAFTGNPLKGTLTATGFNVPAVVATSTCPSAIAGAVNSSTPPGLGLPTTNTSETATLTQTNQQITTTTSTTPPTTAPPATTTTAPVAVSSNANFTG
jgi:hypothetical protein